MSTILYVYAHPDDETFGSGGTICHYRDAGSRQVLYCATEGEAGKVGDPAVCTKEELGFVRRQELKRATDILGINELIHRNHGDGKLVDRPFELLVEDVLEVLEKERPEMVITFPPHGISGHKDHIVIQQVTLAAVKRVSFPTVLYYNMVPESIGKKLGRTRGLDPDELIDHSIDVHHYQTTIVEALKQHRTQHLSVERAFQDFNEDVMRNFRTKEYFQLGWKSQS